MRMRTLLFIAVAQWAAVSFTNVGRTSSVLGYGLIHTDDADDNKIRVNHHVQTKVLRSSRHLAKHLSRDLDVMNRHEGDNLADSSLFSTNASA